MNDLGCLASGEALVGAIIPADLSNETSGAVLGSTCRVAASTVGGVHETTIVRRGVVAHFTTATNGNTRQHGM